MSPSWENLGFLHSFGVAGHCGGLLMDRRLLSSFDLFSLLLRCIKMDGDLSGVFAMVWLWSWVPGALVG
jgi:hypothetical protein